jgi:hypothetical protein
VFNKLPHVLPCPFVRRPIDRTRGDILDFGPGYYIDRSKDWPLRVKLREFYLSKTLGIRQRISNKWWAFKWWIGVHPAQKKKEK